jgi:hypothetical protein
MRRAARVDGNHGTITDALRSVGCWVRSTAGMGDGFPDLLVWYWRTGFTLLEVKDPAQPPSKRVLTTRETEFFRSCPGRKARVETVAQAFDAVGIGEATFATLAGKTGADE